MKGVRGITLLAILIAGFVTWLLIWVGGWYVWELEAWGSPGGEIFMPVSLFHNFLGVISAVIVLPFPVYVIKKGKEFVSSRDNGEPVNSRDIEDLEEKVTRNVLDLKKRVLSNEENLGDLKIAYNLRPPEGVDTKTSKDTLPGTEKAQQKNNKKKKIDTKTANQKTIKVESLAELNEVLLNAKPGSKIIWDDKEVFKE